ncbi:MAG TPA: hypothetical protein VK787_12900 [Puia sp.]|nr:hypothetical protein [Puia sp.]
MKNNYIEKLSGRFRNHQHSIADKIHERTKHFSVRKKKIILILFCALFSTVSAYTIFDTLTKKFPNGDFNINRISIPHNIGRNFQQPFGNIDSGTFNRVEHFRFYLDSLKTANASSFESIINIRPNLIDSILAFEKIYQSQLKK